MGGDGWGREAANNTDGSKWDSKSEPTDCETCHSATEGGVEAKRSAGMAICEWPATQHFFAGTGAAGTAGMESWQSEGSVAEVAGATVLRSSAGQNGWTTTTAITSNASFCG